MVRQAFPYRIHPTPAQENLFLRTLDLCRQVYNSFLHWRKHDYETLGKAPTRNQQIRALPRWKQKHPELCQVFSQTLQEVAKRVDLAFASFFRRVKGGETPGQTFAKQKVGYPRFKGAGQYDSFTYPQSGFSLTDEGLSLSKIGTVAIIVHRPLQGKVKTLTIRRRSGKWYAVFTCEVEATPLPSTGQSIGIDVGLLHFATLSDGSVIENPRFLRHDEKALTKAQRKLSRACRGSVARRKAKKVVSRIHERIRNPGTRASRGWHNFLHQLSRSLVNRFDTIAVEALNVKGMSRRPHPVKDEETEIFLPTHVPWVPGASRKAGLNKNILDASWSMFHTLLAQKAGYPRSAWVMAGRLLLSVEAAFTSQDCSCCGYRPPPGKRKTLDERVHSCPECGVVLNRDHNAALNISSLGLQRVGVARACTSDAVEAATFMCAE